MKVARRQARLDALVYLDLTRFKAINDTYGHAAGDAALVAVARVLRSAVREGDIVARLGGDEFVVHATGVQGPGSVGVLAGRLRALLRDENALARAAGRPYDIEAGIGVQEYVPGDDLDAWIARADAALYADKESGREARSAQATG
jgi:diguanylate cyclase (GGDEF)-like protein